MDMDTYSKGAQEILATQYDMARQAKREMQIASLPKLLYPGGGTLEDTRSLQERLDQRRMRAEQEIIAVSKLQTLLNSLPDGMTHGQLSQLVNL